MSETTRRAFLVGTAGAGAVGIAAMTATPSLADTASPSTGAKHRYAGAHPHYNLKTFKQGLHKRWRAGSMTLKLDALHPITTGDGKHRLHEGAFVAVFSVVDGTPANGTVTVKAPSGLKFPLHLTRIVSTDGKPRLEAVINRWVPAS